MGKKRRQVATTTLKPKKKTADSEVPTVSETNPPPVNIEIGSFAALRLKEYDDEVQWNLF